MAKVRASRIVLVALVLFVLGAGAFVLILPRLVKSRIVAVAEAHGVALTIDDLGLAPGKARLSGVRATVAKVPGLSASCAKIDVDLDGLTPTALALHGPALQLEGPYADVRAALDALAKDTAQTSATSPLVKITVDGGSLEWKRPLGAAGSSEARARTETSSANLNVDAKSITGNVTRVQGRALGDDYHFETSALRVFQQADVAPWGASLDSSAKGYDAQLVLGDPKKADSARVKLTKSAQGAITLDANTPRTTTKELGIPQQALGMIGDETSKFELHLHHAERDADHAEGTVVLVADGIFLGHSTARTGIKLDARYAGDPKGTFKIAGGTLQAGPFTGALEGGFQATPQAFKATLRYSSGLMSCRDAVAAQASNYGDVGKGVAALANMLGLDRVVEGRIMLKGEVDIDTRAEAQASKMSFHTEGDCKLSYLPSP